MQGGWDEESRVFAGRDPGREIPIAIARERVRVPHHPILHSGLVHGLMNFDHVHDRAPFLAVAVGDYILHAS